MMALHGMRWPALCVLLLLAASVVFTPRRTAAGALPQAVPSFPSVINPIVLTDSWPIKRFLADRSGAIVFAGGDFRGGADGLVYVAPGKFAKLAALGDPVPGREGIYLTSVGWIYGLPSDFSFNAKGDLAFTAAVVNCGSPSRVTRCGASAPLQGGLFLYSQTGKTTIALQGDPVPGVAGATFLWFERVRINARGDVAFWTDLLKVDGSLTSGLFIFSSGLLQKILMTGDVTPFGSDPVQYLSGYLFLNDNGAVTFLSGFKAGDWSILRSQDGVLSRVFGSGDPAPWGGRLGDLWTWDESEQGFDVINSGHEIYVHAKDGSVSRIVSAGDPTPVGGQYVLLQQASHYMYGVPVEVNDSGEPMFGPAPDGIFLNNRGGIEKVASGGDPVPGVPGTTLSPLGWNFGNLGMAAFTAHVNSLDGNGLFLYSKGLTFGVYLPGDPAPQTDGSFKDQQFFFLTDSGDVIFHSTVCCGKIKEGIFQASFPRLLIPNGSFETADARGLPLAWQLTWANSGSGDVRQYNCGGSCAQDGSNVLRLHVDAGGGSVFVVSDPIPVAPSTAYMITDRMRYRLSSDSDAVFFTIIQQDPGGNTIDLSEFTGTKLDGSGDWVPKGMLIRTKPTAASIRIRIGLASATETTLDVDSVR